MDRTRYAVVGTGLMGIEHIRNIRLLDEMGYAASVVAVVDPVERSREWARSAGGEQLALLTSMEELLARSDIDAVVVATPNHTHRDVLEPLWSTPWHLLVEKPMCTTLDDCRYVEIRAEQHEAVVQIGMEYRYMAPIARLISEVESGTVGTLHMLSIREHRFPFLDKVGNWNRFGRNTGGTLVEKCCHFFDLMRVIAGSEPLRVYASGAQDVNHRNELYDGETPDILDNAFVTVDFENGVRALLDLCMFAEASRQQEELVAVGSAGKVECAIPASTVAIGRRPSSQDPSADSIREVRSMCPERVEVVSVPVDAALLAAGHHHGSTLHEHVAFLDSIRSGAPPQITARDGLLAVAMGVAAEISARERRVVTMEELL